MDRDQAIKATRDGAIAAAIVALLTAAITAFAVLSDASGMLALWNDPANLFDIALVAALGYGVYRKSRVAAVLMFVYYLCARLMIGMETGKPFAGMLLALVFLYYFARAIRGAFVFHRIERERGAGYRAGKWAYALGVPAALAVVLALGFGVLSTVGVLPSTRVVAGHEIAATDLQTLIERGVLDADERVEFFYAQGAFSLLESGNVLTDRRVLVYSDDPDEGMLVWEIPLPEVRSIEQIAPGSTLANAEYRVGTDDPDAWLILQLSTDMKGHERFIAELRERVGAGMLEVSSSSPDGG